jgi:rhodanese-related sulfurtransferase
MEGRMSVTRVSPGDLSTTAAGGRAAVLDVRERAAYERGHVFGATSLPRRLLEFRLPTLVTAPATPVLLYDADGTLGDLAAATVAAMSYADVRVLDGGLAGWRAAGRAVAEGINVPSKVFGERVLHEMKTPMIGPHELQDWQRRGRDLVVVDVRTPEEYRRGCVPTAWNLPGMELPFRIADLLAGPDTTIVVHCGGRTRSHIGAESLRRLGLPNRIVALENGTMGWELAGLALERGADRRPAPPSADHGQRTRDAARRIAAEDGLAHLSARDLAARWARRREDNLHVFDVRTAEEYAEGHVAGAVWAPGGQLVQTTDEFVAVRAASIVLVCDGSLRAVLAAGWLRRMGLPDVAVLDGGLDGWARAGGTVERGLAAPEPFGYAEARRAVPPVGPDALARADLVLDVDTSDVYARGHVPAAAWICRSRLERRIEDAGIARPARLVVTSADGVHATLAAATLRALGHDAAVLEGGTSAWERAGRPLERGATRLLDDPDDVVLKPYDRGRTAMEAYLRWEEHLRPDGTSPEPLFPGVDQG